MVLVTWVFFAIINDVACYKCGAQSPKFLVVISHVIASLVNLSTFVLGIYNLVFRIKENLLIDYCDQEMIFDNTSFFSFWMILQLICSVAAGITILYRKPCIEKVRSIEDE